MRKIHNPTDKPTTLWWGHSPYFIGAGETVEVEDVITRALKHKDYEHLQLIELPNEASENAETSRPWDSDDWDPYACGIDELRAYASTFDLKIHEDISESQLRDLCVEHFMMSQE